MRSLMSYFALLATLLTMVANFLCSGWAYAQQAQQNDVPEKPEIIVQIAVILNQSGPVVAFSVTNNSNKDLVIDEAGVNSSPVVITKSNGEEVVDSVIIERTGALPVVKAGQTRIEKGNVLSVFDLRSLFKPGIYRLRWRVTPHGSNKSYTSNELHIMRDASIPIIDPRTGEPFTPEIIETNPNVSVKARVAQLLLGVKLNSAPKENRFAVNPSIDEAIQELGKLKVKEVTPLLFDRILIYRSYNPPTEKLIPSTGQERIALEALVDIGSPVFPLLMDKCATSEKDDCLFTVIYLNRELYKDALNRRDQTVYQFTQYMSSYGAKAKNLRKWSEKLPYGEMPTAAMLQAEPIAAPEIKPAPNFANEAEREAAINRLARIFELKDVLTAKDVEWTQDAERQKVFAALDELIQLNALGEGEAGKEIAQMLDFMFAPAPPPHIPVSEFPGPDDPKPIVTPHPIKPLVFPTVPQGSTKTETYFPAVPKLIMMGPRIAPFIIEAMAEKNSLQFAQNAAYTLRRILGSDEAIKKLLLEHAELNEKKAARLRELRDSIPQN